MWTYAHSIETSAGATTIFAIFEDVGTWAEWNTGVERMELNGRFATGTTGTMFMPGQDPLATTAVGAGGSRRHNPRSSAIRRAVALAELMTPGRPAPGCVPAPTR